MLHKILAPLRWVERTRGRRRYLIVFGLLVTFLSIGSVAWRYLGLWGLPDVGDPTTLTQSSGGQPSLSPDKDAIAQFDKAARSLVPYSGGFEQGMVRWKRGSLFMGTPVSNARFATRWQNAAPELCRWVQSNQQALELCELGAECPDASTDAEQPAFFTEASYYSLVGLALLEGARLEAAGEHARAWAWYRAACRAIRHLGNADSLARRYRLEAFVQPALLIHVERWTNDPQVDPALLRTALRDILLIDSLAGHDVERFKTAYQATMDQLERLTSAQAKLGSEVIERRIQTFGYHHSFVIPKVVCKTASIPAAGFLTFVLNEPERTKRVVRLYYENWITTLPALHAGTGSFYRVRQSFPLVPDLLTKQPGVWPAPGRLTSEQFAGCATSTIYAEHVLPHFETYRRGLALRSLNQGTLIMRVAEALYAREHGGALPTKPDVLIGPYLKQIPDLYKSRDFTAATEE